MGTPLQLLIPDQYDLAARQMREAYEGDSAAWQAVSRALRDAIVEYARRRVPYYRSAIPEGTPFEEVPVLTKSVLRDRFDDLHAEGVPEWRRHRVRTSGSTGEPVTVDRDIHQLLIESVSSDRVFRSLHGVPFDATIVAVTSTSMSGELFSPWGRRWRRLLHRLGGPPARDPWLITAPTLTVRLRGELQRHLDRWARLRSYFLIGQASAMDWMAGEIEAGRARLGKRPVAIAATGDMLTSAAKERIERVFGAWVHSRYGSVEMPWLAASMPDTTDRFVCNPFLAHVELLDGAGRPAGPGEIGRIVITDLNNRVMPLIRYDLGDLAAASAEGHVGAFRLFEGLIGRESELLRFPSGRILSSSNLDKVISHGGARLAGSLRAFQCRQTGPNSLEMRVVWDGPAAPERLVEALRAVADPDTDVRVVEVNELERHPSGKVWIVRGLTG